jgi:hypothetical protein
MIPEWIGTSFVCMVPLRYPHRESNRGPNLQQAGALNYAIPSSPHPHTTLIDSEQFYKNFQPKILLDFRLVIVYL